MMLQQTQVATVIPYFERFLKRFPTVKDLAKASEPAVLKLWAGLGYYSRARNLRKAAKIIVAQHKGVIPSDVDSLRALPGIGRYSAGAISSIAFEEPNELVDGNVIRVFARLFGLRGDPKKPATQEKVWGLAAESLQRKRPGDWNQALMELGARVCIPDSPLCGDCPVSKSCFAFKNNLQESLPEPTASRTSITLTWTAILARESGKVLLWKRSKDERFLPGHWALPERRHLKGVRLGKTIKTVKHSITHHRITVHVCEGKIPTPLPDAARWVPSGKTKDRLVSSLWRKAVA